MMTDGFPRDNDFQVAIRGLNHSMWEVRASCAEELGSLKDKRATIPLIRLLDDGVGAVRFAAAESLGMIRDDTAIPALLKQLRNPEFGSYAPLIESLCAMRAEQAIPDFINFLRDHDPRIRALAANALSMMTRQFISYNPRGTEEERELAISQWQVWWQKSQKRL